MTEAHADIELLVLMVRISYAKATISCKFVSINISPSTLGIDLKLSHNV